MFTRGLFHSFVFPLFFLAIVTFPVSFIGAISCANVDRELSDEFQRAIVLYDAGWSGSDEALLEASALLQRMMTASRTAEPLMRAYHGSASVARARLVPDGQKRRWLQLGASELDAAVRAAPDDVQIRLLRAITFAILPRLAGRVDTALEDFDWLVAKAEVEGRDGLLLADSCRQVIYYHAGSFAMRNRDPRAVGWLELAVEIGATGEMDMDRVRRALQLARSQTSSQGE